MFAPAAMSGLTDKAGWDMLVLNISELVLTDPNLGTQNWSPEVSNDGDPPRDIVFFPTLHARMHRTNEDEVKSQKMLVGKGYKFTLPWDFALRQADSHVAGWIKGYRKVKDQISKDREAGDAKKKKKFDYNSYLNGKPM